MSAVRSLVINNERRERIGCGATVHYGQPAGATQFQAVCTLPD